MPTEAQAIAGNYRMGRVNLHGLPIRIENVRGSYREGTAPDGTQWRTRLAAHYGYFFGTRGADGDAIDVFVGLFPESVSVWVINQRHVGGKSGFDEHKVMLGFHTEQQARDAYTHSFDRGWTGLMSIVPASITQLKWWLKHGNHKNPFSAAALPYDGENTMLDKVLWDSNAQPTSNPLHRVLYDLRINDTAGLLLDAMSVQDLMTDPDIESVPVYDALVVEVASMQRKMTLLQSTMEAAGVSVKPLEMTISDPVKSRGVLQVMVLFTMSDGQTVSIWFHNPDTTPAKLTPLDELISWKWLINKKDVTIVVAPERGRDLNVREVSRRVMRLVEKNSEAFTRANAKAGERAAVTEALKTEIAGLEVTLSGLLRKIEVAKVANEGADVSGPNTLWNEYQALKSQNPDALLAHRAGDFYEFMGDDAKTVADAEELTLTRRGEIPMVGFGVWALPQHLDSLAKKGFEVAVSERDENGKSFVKEVFGVAVIDLIAPEPVVNPIEPDIEPGPEIESQAPEEESAELEVTSVAEDDPVAIVDAAYPFTTATEAFKRWIADSVTEVEYSPFATAKAMDMKAHELGGSIAWDVSTAVLDSVDVADKPEPMFPWMLDDAGEAYETVIGVISNNGTIVGRAHIGGDGKAMVFVGTEGLTRVELEGGTRAVWSDDDAAEMVGALLAKPNDIEAPQVVPEVPAPVETDVSRLNAADRLVSKDAILSDDPQAIEKLEAKLTALRLRQEFMKKANKLFKSGDDAGLLAMGLSQFQIDSLKKPDFAGRTGFADYLLSNNNGVIGTTRKRLESMIKAHHASEVNKPEPVADGGDPIGVTEDTGGELVVSSGEPLSAAEIAPVAPTVVERVDIPAAVEAPVEVVDPIQAVDTAYLSTMIDGTADMFAADILERLEPMFARYESDVSMMDLLNQAAQAYSDAAVKAAQAALATA